MAKFNINELEQIWICLAMNVIIRNVSTTINQINFVHVILERFNMNNRLIIIKNIK